VRLPALLLVALVLFVGLLLLVDWHFPATTWWRVIQDFSHVPMFAALTAAVYCFLRFPPRVSSRLALLIAAGSATAIGAVTELLQSNVGRSGSWGDFRQDLVGVGVALCTIAAIDSRLTRMRSLRGLAASLAIVSIGVAAAPVAHMYSAYAYRDANFPELATMRDAREMYWILARGVRREIDGDGLMVEFGQDQYPGVSWYEPVPDWRGYRSLTLEVSNPNDARLEITLRIHDRAHTHEYADRFNRVVALRAHERRRVIVSLEEVRVAPFSRAMDLARIADVSIFRSSAAGSAALRIHRLALER
jgi:hypothetical protein